MSLRVKALLKHQFDITKPQPSFRELFCETAQKAADAPVRGLFINSADPMITEICAGAGFDYLLIDGEHSPLTLEAIQNQLRAIFGHASLAMVRVPANDTVLIKQYLDAGVQSLLVPMVSSANDAREAVSAVTYPPEGARGVGAALARSARWNRIPGYLNQARETISLIVQIETAEGVENIDEITAVEGVDALFIGPSDLAATMGFLDQQAHPEVISAVQHVITQAKSAGKIVGVNAFDQDQARDYLEAGADFINIGADVALLARASESLAARWCQSEDSGVASSY